MPSTRRTFVADVALAAGLLVLPSCRPKRLAVTAPSVLSRAEWEILDHVSERLLPADDTPGARAANVVGYIDAQLADPHLSIFKTELRTGLWTIDALAEQPNHVGFPRLAAPDQDVILHTFQAAADGPGTFSSSHCFALLLTLTLEGFLSAPHYGGNREHVGYHTIGYVPEHGWLRP